MRMLTSKGGVKCSVADGLPASICGNFIQKLPDFTPGNISLMNFLPMPVVLTTAELVLIYKLSSVGCFLGLYVSNTSSVKQRIEPPGFGKQI